MSNVNDLWNTWFGLDKMGQQLAKFTLDCCNIYQPKHISFIGHSLGGLMIRNCIGYLEKESFFDKMKPIFYISIATPHLGIFSISDFKHFLAKYLLNLTGKELLMQDNNKMLLKMSQADTYYYIGLQKFKKIIAYGNIENDTLVCLDSTCITYPMGSENNTCEQLIVIEPNNFNDLLLIHQIFSQEIVSDSN